MIWGILFSIIISVAATAITFTKFGNLRAIYKLGTAIGISLGAYFLLWGLVQIYPVRAFEAQIPVWPLVLAVVCIIAARFMAGGDEGRWTSVAIIYALFMCAILLGITRVHSYFYLRTDLPVLIALPFLGYLAVSREQIGWHIRSRIERMATERKTKKAIMRERDAKLTCYRQRMEALQSEGYDVTELRQLNRDTAWQHDSFYEPTIIRAFTEFENKVERLKKAEKELDSLSRHEGYNIFSSEVKPVRSMLKSLDKVNEVEQKVDMLKNRILDYVLALEQLAASRRMIDEARSWGFDIAHLEKLAQKAELALSEKHFAAATKHAKRVQTAAQELKLTRERIDKEKAEIIAMIEEATEKKRKGGGKK